jgi:acetyl-CoA acetyltransferase
MRAAAAISYGICDVAVVGGGRAGVQATSGSNAPLSGASLGREFLDVWAASSLLRFALVAQRHMQLFGTTSGQLARIAAGIRNNGHVNPEAVMFGKGPYTVADVLASRLVTTPFHLLDICIMSEGGAAVVLTAADRAPDLRHRPVAILGGSAEYVDAPQPDVPTYERVGRVGAGAARRALASAEVDVHDIDVFGLYDPNSFEVLRQFELLGLCEEGEGGAFAETGSFELGGKHPVNPDGGLLSQLRDDQLLRRRLCAVQPVRVRPRRDQRFRQTGTRCSRKASTPSRASRLALMASTSRLVASQPSRSPAGSSTDPPQAIRFVA